MQRRPPATCKSTEMAMTATTPWDPADHLKTVEDMSAYLDAALEEGESTLIAAALGDIARAKGMTQVAREAGLGRESLYKALFPAGNPEFATILKVVSVLGLQLHSVPASAKSSVYRKSALAQLAPRSWSNCRDDADPSTCAPLRQLLLETAA